MSDSEDVALPILTRAAFGVAITVALGAGMGFAWAGDTGQAVDFFYLTIALALVVGILEVRYR